MLLLCGLQQRGYYLSVDYTVAEGILPLSWVTAVGILPLSGLQHRGYCHCLSVREGMLPLSVFQRGCFHSVGYSRGDTAMLWVTAEVIPQLCELQPRGYCYSLGYSRGCTATLWVTAKGILPQSVCQRGDTATLWVTSDGILPRCWLQQRPLSVCLSERGYCQSLGYIRW